MSDLTTDTQRNQQQSLIKAALRLTDPTANVVVDAQTGHLNVVTVLSRGEVQRILAGLGVSPVEPPIRDELHASGDCCGGCA